MEKREFISVLEFAELLGVSRIAIYKRIKKGQIDAVRIGRSYAIPKKYVNDIVGKTLSEKNKKMIAAAVKRTFKEYGEVIKRLGRE